MKIIQINTVYGTGSTGKIVASLYTLSENNGFEARVAYGRGHRPEQNKINGFLIGNKPDFYAHVLYNFFIGSSGFASKRRTKKFLRWLDAEKPSLLHLHNLHGFYIHVGMLFEYIKAKNIPVVWTLHDCWAFTGQCSHFDYIGCDKWKTGCHHCPIFRSDYPYSILRDNSKNNYIQKKEAFTGVKDMTIVTPSLWLSGLIKHSFLREYPVTVIANGIDLNVFKPSEINETIGEKALPSFPDNENLYDDCTTKVLLGVANVWDKNKGLSYLLELSHDFNPSTGYQIVIIGLSNKQIKEINKKYEDRILALPKTSSWKELVSWYRKATIYINPSLQESFSLTNVEALACGTPTISFNSGGTPETIIPIEQLSDISPSVTHCSSCGILVPKGNYDYLQEAIREIANNTDTSRYSAELCREHAITFDSSKQFSKYIDLYHKILSKDR